MKNRNLGESFKNAISGIFYVVKAERNMKLHILAVLVVIFLSISYRLGKIETMFVCLTIALVIVCELFNTAIEVLVDLVVQTYHPKAKIVKDVAAGAVLMSAIISVIIGYIIFIDNVSRDVEKYVKILKDSDIKITIVVLSVILLLLIIRIAQNKRIAIKESIDGLISFASSSIATAVLLWNGNIKDSILFIGIAVLLIFSRIKRKMQNTFELTVGAVLGFFVTILIYQLLR